MAVSIDFFKTLVDEEIVLQLIRVELYRLTDFNWTGSSQGFANSRNHEAQECRINLMCYQFWQFPTLVHCHVQWLQFSSMSISAAISSSRSLFYAAKVCLTNIVTSEERSNTWVVLWGRNTVGWFATSNNLPTWRRMRKISGGNRKKLRHFPQFMKIALC